MSRYKWPLAKNQFAREDLDAAIGLLKQEDPQLTNGLNVREFEAEFSSWLGVKHSVFVNSGASANLLTMHLLKQKYGPGSVIVPALTWSSDVMSVMHAGLEPRFVDVDRRTLGMDFYEMNELLKTESPLALFPTHCMGYSARHPQSPWVIKECEERGIKIVEDCCESIGAIEPCGKKTGSIFGDAVIASNFSFYYAHHMTTVEGGMVCTDDDELYETLRMMRGHGMVRERTSGRQGWYDRWPDLNPEFIFAVPGFNVRPTEIAAVIGRSQLRRLDENNARRNENLRTFLDHIDPEASQTEFATEGCSSYALTLVLQDADPVLRDAVERLFVQMGVEHRRGVAGGGNQVRQPYLKHLGIDPTKFPVAEHLHSYGWYVGNRPDLQRVDVLWLCERLNSLVPSKVAV